MICLPMEMPDIGRSHLMVTTKVTGGLKDTGSRNLSDSHMGIKDMVPNIIVPEHPRMETMANMLAQEAMKRPIMRLIADWKGKAGIAALFAILLGGFGVQYFYLGKIAGGIITIILSLVTCGIWYWVVLVQGILMFCMDNSTFRRKYVLTNSTFPLF